MGTEDLLYITASMNPHVDPAMLKLMIEFNIKIARAAMVDYKMGRKGSPWDFNLRDVFRWCDFLKVSPRRPAPFYCPRPHATTPCCSWPVALSHLFSLGDARCPALIVGPPRIEPRRPPRGPLRPALPH